MFLRRNGSIIDRFDPVDIREMLRQIRSNPFWLGGMNYVNTAAACGTQQEIHAPALDTSTRRWYTVVMGTEVGIFTSWYVSSVYLSEPP